MIRSSRLSDGRGRLSEYGSSNEAGVTNTPWLAVSHSIHFGDRASVTIPHTEDLNFEYNQPFSFTCWFYLDVSRPYGSYERIFYAKSLISTPYTGLMIVANATNKIYVALVNSWAAPNNAICKIANVATSTSAWHHLMVTYSGSSTAAGVIVYVDNASIAMTVNYDTLSASTKTTRPSLFGWDGPGATNWLDGNMCEVAFYNKALSVSEINAIYNARVPVNPEGLATAGNLIGYWRLGTGDIYPFALASFGGEYPESPNLNGKFLGAMGGLISIDVTTIT